MGTYYLNTWLIFKNFHKDNSLTKPHKNTKLLEQTNKKENNGVCCWLKTLQKIYVS